MSRLSIAVDVDAPPEVVWDLIADPHRQAAWQTFSGDVITADGEPGAPGSTYTTVQRVAGHEVRSRVVVTAAERPRLIETSSTSERGWSRHRTTVEARPNDRAHVSAEFQYELPGLVLGTVRRQVPSNDTEREFRRSYVRLREILEPSGAEPGDLS